MSIEVGSLGTRRVSSTVTLRIHFLGSTIMDLTDAQWDRISVLIPDPPRRADNRGRPWRPARDVLNGILWVLRTGAPWKDLPDRYPPYQTCHRRFQQWQRSGVLETVLTALAEDLDERGGIDI